MSLVNDMLNDLEQRRGERADKPVDLGWLTGQPAAARRRSLRPLYIIVGLVSVLLVAAIGWQYRPGPSLNAVSAIDIEPAEPDHEKINRFSAATLSAISWVADDGQVRLHLTMDKLHAYSLQRKEEGLLLRLHDVASQLQDEQLKPILPVRQIELQRQENDLLLNLAIDGEYRFSDRVITAPTKQIEIVIDTLVVNKEVADSVALPEQTQATNTVQSTVKSKAAKPKRNDSNRLAGNTPKSTTQLTLSQRDLQLVNRVKDQMRAGDYYHAEQKLEAFVEQNPGAVRASKLLATLRIKQQRYDRAGDLLESILVQAPDDIEARILKARLLMAMGDNNTALQWLMSSKPALAKYPSYYELMGLAARKNQQYLLSEQVYRGLVDSDQSRGDWWVGLGIALDAQVKAAAAREAFQRALDSQQTPPQLRQYAQQRLAMRQ